MSDEQIEQADATASATVATLEQRIRTIEATPVQDRSPGQFDEVRVLRAKLAVALAKLLPVRRLFIDRITPKRAAEADKQWEQDRLRDDPRPELESLLGKIGNALIECGARPEMCRPGGGMRWFMKVNQEHRLIENLARLELKCSAWAADRQLDDPPPGEGMKQAAEQGFQALQQYAQRVARAAEGLPE